MGSSGANTRKKGEYSLLSEITSEEEWSKLSSREGLFIIDVYSEWSGPCLAMTNFLKKIKLEINDDMLHYASAKIDSIPSLSKFNGLCRPLWLVLSFGQVVAVVHGANAPLLGRVIETEIENEKMVLAGEKVREHISLDDVLSEFVPMENASLYTTETEGGSPIEEDHQREENQGAPSIIDDFALLILPQIDESLFSHLTEFLQSSNFILAKHLIVQDDNGLIKELISSTEDDKKEESFNLLLITKESPISVSPYKELEALHQDLKCPLACPEFEILLAKKNDFLKLLEEFFLEKDSPGDLMVLFLQADSEEVLPQEDILKTSTCLITESLISSNQLANSDKLVQDTEMSMYLLRIKEPLPLFDSAAHLSGDNLSQNLIAELFKEEDNLEEIQRDDGETTEEVKSDPVAFLSSLVGSC